MTCNVFDIFTKRRSVYDINNNIDINNKDIEKIISNALDLYPSSFNAQESRIVLLMGEHHSFFWDTVKQELFKATDDSKREAIEKRIHSFKNGYGTVLYFIDENIVKELAKQYPLYAPNFPIWAEQSNAMLQFMIWTALANNNIGANLQHYNPLIDNVIKDIFKINKHWKLVAQMPFGGITQTTKIHEIKNINDRLIIRP